MSAEQALAEIRPADSGRSARSIAADILTGVAAALVAVLLRYLLPLSPMQLPTVTVVVAVALTGTFVGLTSGVTAAVVGGLLCTYIFFTPFAWESPAGTIPLIGFAVIAGSILTTSHLYRVTARRSHRAELAALRMQAETSQLFAREMAHRLKNALAIVQSIAFQTMGNQSEEAMKFSARLKALADAHSLLDEHVERPTAEAAEVVRLALQPFDDGSQRVDLDCAAGRLAASQVVSLALVLHELSTNALKYGALSSPGGRVSLRIEALNDRIRLSWSESGGPRVAETSAKGFGTSLLRRLGTDTDVAFAPEGFRCSLSLRAA